MFWWELPDMKVYLYQIELFRSLRFTTVWFALAVSVLPHFWIIVELYVSQDK